MNKREMLIDDSTCSELEDILKDNLIRNDFISQRVYDRKSLLMRTQKKQYLIDLENKICGEERLQPELS